MSTPLILHEDRLFPAEPSARAAAHELYGEVRGPAIPSPHGHTDPARFATSAPYGNAAERLVTTEGPHEAPVRHQAIRDVAVDLACTLPKRAYKL